MRQTLRRHDVTYTSHISRLVSALALGWMSLYGAQLTPEMRSSDAACLLSYESGAPLDQGDVLARLGVQFGGGDNGWGSGLEGRIGLSGDRELHLRSGACARSELWGWALEAGATQRIIAHHGHGPNQDAHLFRGPIDLGARLSVISFSASESAGEARSDIGFQAVAQLSYPLSFARRRGVNGARARYARATLGFGLGVSSYASDRRELIPAESALSPSPDTALISSWVWSELITLSAQYYLIERLPLSIEARWVDDGLLVGLSVGYQL